MSRRREFQAGAVFSQVHAPLPGMVTAPWVSTDEGQQDVKLSTLGASQKRLDPARVRHYVENPDHEPVTVIHTPAGRVLYDGHHRAAAAKARGEKTIRANVRSWR